MKLRIDINDLSEAIVGKRVMIKWYADEYNPVPQVDLFDGHLVLNREDILEYKKETEEVDRVYIEKVEIFGYYETEDQNGFPVKIKVFNEDALKEDYLGDEKVLVEIVDAE